jgi:Outer membrane protein beta-barrel family
MKIKKSRVFLLAGLLYLLNFQAQSQVIQSVRGKVVSKTNEPLMGNVIALSVVDSSYIAGASFLDSTFTLSNLNKTEFLLKFTSLSFADTLLKVAFRGQANIDLGNIVVVSKQNLLNAVTVVGKQPLIRNRDDGTIEVNVANTVLSASSSVVEILSKSPNVIENGGQLSVIGKGEAILYLNGKQITYERLSSIPVSRILRVEVIPNPSAEYDAEGKAVINIITKTTDEEGILGTVSQQVTYSDFAGTNAQTFLDLNYVKGTFSVLGNYSLLLGDNREYLETTRTRPAIEEFLKSDLSTDWRRKMKNYSNFGLGVQYNIDKVNNFSLAFNGFSENLGGNVISRNNLITKADNSFYASNIAKDEIRTNGSVTLNYNRKTDAKGSTLFVGTQYSLFNSDIDDFITENRTVNTIEGRRLLKNDVDHNIAVSSSQIDFTKVLANNKKLDMGAKFSYVTTESATNFLIAENSETYLLDNTLSNKFRYDEKISAAYLSYGGAIKKLNFGIGIRGEWTNYTLNTSVGGGQLLRDDYLNFFPNFQVNTAISKDLKLRASYLARITRPRYQALNPFVVYQDPFTTIEGNPNLVPEKIHAFEVGANYKNYDFRMGYNYSIDPMDAAALRGVNPNSYVLKAINLEAGHSFFSSLSKTFSLKWWTSVNTITVNYTNLIDNQYAFALLEPRPQLYLYSNNTFNFNNLFKLQLLTWYLGRRQYGIKDDFSRYLVMLGIEKDLLNRKLKLRLVANDIFRTTNAWGEYNVGRTDIFYNRTFNNAYFRFIATWNFGQLKEGKFKSKSTGQAENLRAN